MLVSSASLGENILSNSDDHSDVLSSNISSSQNNEDDPPLGGPESLITSNIQSESEREVISTSKERVDLGRMMSQQVNKLNILHPIHDVHIFKNLSF